MTEYSPTYAQNREDILLNGFFHNSTKGFYVDVGASDPDMFSVTKLFYEKGWRGVNIEPIPQIYKRLKAARPGDINLNIGASDKKGTLSLREYPHADGLSTFSPVMQEEYVHNSALTKEYVDRKVPVLPLREVFEQHEIGPIDFMKIDVEGFEYEVIAGNDWGVFRPKVLCIEANHILKDWRPLIKKYNYELVFFDGLNEYYVAKEHRTLAKDFSYTEAVLNKPPVPAEFYERAEEVTKKVRPLQLDNAHLAAHIRRMENDAAQDRRVRSVVKKLASALDIAVVANLQRLNWRKPPPPSLTIAKTMDRGAVLDVVRTFDFDTYFPPQQSITYKVVYGMYRGVTQAVYLLVRAAFRMTKREHNV